MVRLIRSIVRSELFAGQLPVLLGATLIAEIFYQFHSFVLETAAFLATWFVLDLLLQAIMWLAGHKKAPRATFGRAGGVTVSVGSVDIPGVPVAGAAQVSFGEIPAGGLQVDG